MTQSKTGLAPREPRGGGGAPLKHHSLPNLERDYFSSKKKYFVIK